MGPRMHFLLVVFIAAIAREAKLTNANVIFRFELDFHVKSDKSTEQEDVINKTVIFNNDHITVKNNLNPDESIEEKLTERPEELLLVTTTVEPPRSMSDFWLEEQNLTGMTDKKLKEIVEALTKLNEEISPVVGRSDFGSSKVKIITRYLNILDASAAEALSSNTTSSGNKFEYLRKFIKLVDKLKEPPMGVNGGERTMEYLILKLALEKYQIAKLQADVEEQVIAAEKAWQQYRESKLVEVNI
ncbi:uncharacterized protein LOC129249215 [Anastrepha obliqua]|uniref:uncharacterized protein LOC129249215 n=1 Tax=Anastrepha obliqua TaxID=95512 RepID=UPI002409F30B|nr:uncharacterized protein LOC129249215 [Anastrepha obliqua]